MRYPKEHKEQARQRLVEGGARLAKKRGFAAAGVDDLAAAAGVTSGSVYKHFGGKSELLAAIIEAELGRSAARFATSSGRRRWRSSTRRSRRTSVRSMSDIPNSAARCRHWRPTWRARIPRRGRRSRMGCLPYTRRLSGTCGRTMRRGP